MTPHRKWLVAGSALVLAALAGIPRAAKAVLDYRTARRAALIDQAGQALANGDDAIDWSVLRDPDAAPVRPGSRPQPEQDDARLRQLANEAQWGVRSAEFNAELLRITRAEMAKWGSPGAGAARPGVSRNGMAAPLISSGGTRAWTNAGPANARVEWNGGYYNAVDSGRPTALSIDDANGVVYVATSGGGVWKTSNLSSAQPTWTPITESLGNIAVGAMDVLPGGLGAPCTLWIGLGDAFDQKGGVLVQSVDGGATWGSPILLKGVAGDGALRTATSVRELRIDPSATKVVFAATDAGLFKVDSSGSSPAITLIDLPNPNDATSKIEEATWSVVFTGTDSGGKSHWVVTGVQARVSGIPGPQAGAGSTGNLGDIWTSADGGATWVSARVAGKLPPVGPGQLALDIGRTTVGAGAPALGLTVLYAQAGAYNETSQVGILKSVDGGVTWTLPPGQTLTNRTFDPYNENDCIDLNVAHGQAWYNQAVAVDPTNSNNAIVGGNLCSVRTLDGGTTWSNVSHWLPAAGVGSTANGPLPYVHADWHAAKVIQTGSSSIASPGQVIAFAGTDGGFFMSQNVFAAAKPEQAVWTQPDAGITTHLFYSVAAGEFVSGNPQVMFGGLQDNGTRFRESEFNGGTFDQVIGGDGIGTAVAFDQGGQNPIFFASVEYGRYYCNPRRRSCNNPTFFDAGGNEYMSWFGLSSPPMPSNDGEPFLMRYAPVHDPASSVLTATTWNVWKLSVDQNDNAAYQLLTPNETVINGGLRAVRQIVTTRGKYSVPGSATPVRIYGVTMSAGNYAVITDDDAGNTTFNPSVKRLAGVGGPMSFTSGIAFPHDPAHLGGTDIRKTYLVSSAAPNYGGAVDPRFPILPADGHVFVTTDGGTTWTPFHGNGTGLDLPNVPVNVIKFDPDDATDQTIWAGTDIGVYRSTDAGQTWVRYGTGMPAVRVTDLQISNNGTLVRAATYGRGLWEIVPGSEARTGVKGLADFDRSGAIDFTDLLATAARLGTTPVTAGAPGMPAYDWSLDTDSSGTIDATDLNNVLVKFGSTP